MKTILRNTIIAALLLLSAATTVAQDKPTVMVFFSNHCRLCLDVRRKILPPLKEEYSENLYWLELDTAEADNLRMLENLTKEFNRKKALVPAVFVGDTFLVGFNEIEKELSQTIKAVIRDGSVTREVPKADLVSIFKKLSLFTVMGSGLADGINPCAFAVIVFFISFLAVYGYRRREIIYVGVFYCLAVFLTYLLIGLGIFKFLYAASNVYLFIKGFYYFVAFFCFAMGLAALYDYLRFKKTKDPQGAILQLPGFLKKRINFVIGSRLRHRESHSVTSLILTSFIVGCLVSLLEAVCTGQVYVPTIVFILKSTSLRLKAWVYLILYNLMFVLPLVFIFLLSLAGVKSAVFNRFLKKHLGIIKLIMVFVFFALGGFIIGLS